jgi:hypothetical protein
MPSLPNKLSAVHSSDQKINREENANIVGPRNLETGRRGNYSDLAIAFAHSDAMIQ